MLEIPRRVNPGRLLWAGVHAAALAALLLVSVARPARATTAAEERHWTEFKSPHYTVVSSATPHRTMDIVKRLERYDQTLGTIFNRIAFEPATESLLYLFEDDASMTPFKPRFEGHPVEVLGYYQATRDADYIVMNAGARSDPLTTVYHEKMHAFERQYLPPTPLWFMEGLAECYETFRTDGRTAEIGLVQEDHVQYLQQAVFMPLPALFAVSHSSTDYNEGDRRNVFYAESWALVHYLLWDKPERRPQLVKFLAGLGQGLSPDEAFAAAFDVGIDALAVELKRQLEQSRFHQTEVHFKEELTFETTARVTTLDHGAAAARLGDLMAHIGPEHQTDADAMLGTSLALVPGGALASRALGLVRQDQGKTDDAVHLLEAALAADPRDAIAALHLAGILLGERSGGESGPREPAPPDAVPRARGLLAAAVKARPEFAETAVSYAQCLLLRPDGIAPADLDFALGALESARKRLPYRADAAYDLAVLSAIKGDFARAREVVVQVLPGLGRPETTEAARRAVNDLRRAADRKAAGSAGQGFAGPDPAAPAAIDPAPSSQQALAGHGGLPPLPDDPEARQLALAVTRVPHAFNDEVALFNRVAALGNERNYRDAIRALGRLEALSGDTDMKDRARGLLVMMKKDAERLHLPAD